MKASKVLSWTKQMTLEAYLKSLQVWMEQNKDMSVNMKFYEVVESLKVNKEINGLAEFVGGRVLEELDTVEKQAVERIVEMLEEKYGKTRLEQVEELVSEWMKFNTNEYEKEDEYLYAMEKLYSRKVEKEIEDKEWFSVWMMIEVRKRKGMEKFELQELRNVVKQGGHGVMTEFKKKYKELKVEPNREKVNEAYYMGHESLSRQRYHEQRRRRESQGRDWQRIRRDSQGRDFY